MTIDYDDPATEEKWCAERLSEVAEYLNREGVSHGCIGEWPAWHVAPYVSVWAIESSSHPGSVGRWVICGDLPTDYISAETIKDPRKAVFAIAGRWLEASAYMAKGEQHPSFRVGSPDRAAELSALLKSRASTLIGWANDDSLWEENAL